jgi:membrane-associated HD superfamily phosphohydrolase
MAQKDLRTDRDLLVKDKRATEKNMEDAARKVLPVYDYAPSVLPEIEGIIDSAFSVMRRRSSEKTQKGEVEHILGFELTSREFLVLKTYRFNEKLIKRLEDLTAPLMKQGILLQEEGIVVRNIQTGEEATRRDLDSLLDYQEAKEAIKKTLEGPQTQNVPIDLRGVMAKIINNLVSPNFTFNREETDRRRTVERTLVKPVFFSIEKGEILLRKGERVTEEGLLKLEALREERRKGGTLVMVIGFFLLTGFFVAAFYLFSTKNIRKVSPTNKDILFLILILISSLGMARISVAIAEGLAGAFPGVPLSSYYYFFPVAAGAMLIRVVLNSEVALVYAIFVSLLTGLLLGEGIFLPIFYLIGSIVGAHSVARCDQRSQLIKGGLLVGLTNFLLVSFQGMSTGRIFEPLPA